MKHGEDPGLTLPTPKPHIRIDFVFVPQTFARRMAACDVVRHPQADAASDHYPVVADLLIEDDKRESAPAPAAGDAGQHVDGPA
jgi:endonuclease/exonuclease/phosphatase family metal-dependent hydrolase